MYDSASKQHTHHHGPMRRPGRDPLSCDKYVALHAENGLLIARLFVDGNVEKTHQTTWPDDDDPKTLQEAHFGAQMWANQMGVEMDRNPPRLPGEKVIRANRGLSETK